MKTVIVIPAHNEARNIEATLRSLRKAGYAHIVVIDDGSEDATSLTARRSAIVLHHAINRGMGAALETGTAWALAHGAECIVHFDADGQHRADEVSRVIAPILAHKADVVLGSRYLQPSQTPWTKKYLLHMPALALQTILTGMHLTDVHNGFRALSRRAAQLIRIRQDRMAHASEIISEIQHHRLRYVEVPVTIAYHEYGQGFAAGLKIYGDLILKKILK
ncbi:MAG: glycosyltransferase family 2 protein [Candidatus Komeilibacteria bacterium]|nr:glycosyltransferase family 2 protein [Candidatus Komeilibacteria bacterium]